MSSGIKMSSCFSFTKQLVCYYVEITFKCFFSSRIIMFMLHTIVLYMLFIPFL